MIGLLGCLFWGVLIKVWYLFWRRWRGRSCRRVDDVIVGAEGGEEVGGDGRVPERVVIAWINAFLFIVLWAYLLVSR